MQNYSAKQISGNNEKGQPELAVIVKQTFDIDMDGNCKIAEEQLPLTDEIQFYEHNKALLESDSDLFVQKKYCDVIVKGNARCAGKGRDVAEIMLGEKKLSIVVQGNQKAYIDSYGKIKFADIDPVESIPLRFDFAYGGKDTEAEKQIQLPPAEIMAALPGHDWYADSPFRYPRNPGGKGYLVEFSKNMVEQLEVPNLQDPEHLLTPENILLGDVDRWIDMPIPYATDWVGHLWIPRLAYTGAFEFKRSSFYTLKEMRMKWVEKDIYEKKEPAKSFNYRFFNGGHYALQLDQNNNYNECTLVNIHPKKKIFTIKIPTTRFKIWVDGRKGKLIETRPVMHTIVIEPDEQRLSMVWRGSGAALRPYHKEELKTMPYKVEMK